MSHPAQSISPEFWAPLVESVQSLNSSQLDTLQAALSPRWNKYLAAAADTESQKAAGKGGFPSPTQTAFLLLNQVEHVLFGGAAGGGKSSAMLGAALQYADDADYKALVFRRKFTDLELPDGLIPRSHEWLRGTDAHWQGDKRQWTFPSGAVLKFGYLDSRDDVFNYQGAAAHFFGFEEAGQIDPWHMEYLKTRARRPKSSKVPIRFRYTANPGGVAHEYLYREFVVLGGVGSRHLFVPSFARDNPGLDLADYLQRMEAIADPVLKAQLLRGDWTAADRSNALVPEWTDAIALACTREDARPAYYTPYLAGDIGSRDLTVWLLGYWNFETATLHVLRELVLRDPSTRQIGEGLAALLKETFPELLEKVRGFSDVDYRLIKDLREYGVKLQATQKDDALGHRNRMRAMLGKRQVVVSPQCPVLLKTLKTATWNDRRTDYERSEETGHADAWDTLVYMGRNVIPGLNPNPPEPQAKDGPRWLQEGKPPKPKGPSAFRDAYRRR